MNIVTRHAEFPDIGALETLLAQLKASAKPGGLVTVGHLETGYLIHFPDGRIVVGADHVLDPK